MQKINTNIRIFNVYNLRTIYHKDKSSNAPQKHPKDSPVVTLFDSSYFWQYFFVNRQSTLCVVYLCEYCL